MAKIKSKDLTSCVVREAVTFHSGTVLGLSKKQFAARAAFLQEINKGVYVVDTMVQFKAGEEIQVHGKLDKSARFYLDFDHEEVAAEKEPVKTDETGAKENDKVKSAEDKKTGDENLSLEDKNAKANTSDDLKELANEKQLDLSSVEANGTNGYITKVDVEKAIKALEEPKE